MSSKPRRKQTSGAASRHAATSYAQQSTQANLNDAQSNNFIDLTTLHPDGLWNGIFRPFSTAMVGTDILFISTIIQIHKDAEPAVWETRSLWLLCFGVLVLGFWYVLNQLFRAMESARVPEWVYAALGWCWLLGIALSLGGVSSILGAVDPILGNTFSIVAAALVIIAAIIIFVVSKRPDDKTPMRTNTKAGAED